MKKRRRADPAHLLKFRGVVEAKNNRNQRDALRKAGACVGGDAMSLRCGDKVSPESVGLNRSERRRGQTIEQGWPDDVEAP